MNGRLAVKAVIVRENTLLCVKLKDYADVIAGDYWCLPGGTLEAGETLTAGLHHEMMEETNIPPQIGSLLYISHYHANQREHLEFFFHVSNAEDYTNIDLSNASHAAEEIAALEFVNPKITHILPKFLTTEPLADQISQSLPTKVFSDLTNHS